MTVLKAVEAARQRSLVSRSRAVGYVAKNNPDAFKEALDQSCWRRDRSTTSTTTQDWPGGTLDHDSRTVQQTGWKYCIPIFLKTFGSDVAYATGLCRGK